MLDWRQLYRSRAALERRWRDPEGEPQVQRIEGHRDSVYCLDFDSSRIITGSRDRTIKVWCVKTGKCLATFEGHAGSVLCLKFERDWDIAIPNGEHSDHKIAPTEATRSSEARGFMVSGSSDCSVCVWDLISSRNDKDGAVEIRAEVRKVLRGHAAGVLDLRMDDRWVVSCSKDALINVYSRQTLALHTVLRGHEGPVNAVGLEGGHVVSASGDGKMMLWDVETGERVRVYEGHERGLACIEFKNDLILSGSNDCTIKLWRASTGECLHTFAGHTSLVRALCFDPKTGYIVSASYDRSVRVWEWRDGDGEGSQQTIAGTSSTSGWRGSVMNVAVPGKPKGLGRLVREFRNLHASHIFDVKFDVGRIVR
ncbi:WD40-repeat-containing domain protein [Hygrophoropsis aurantiaca]|uniref:WD40-repeat-containing domain protein n=1 Tax=Hygrophoropsis aurantiaca TaxID=72124 RepID=A0ACB8ARF9_9AGAM|nr:WD40-repeat-containing domain protein [Hygrophoropsis aurantiaca]